MVTLSELLHTNLSSRLSAFKIYPPAFDNYLCLMSVSSLRPKLPNYELESLGLQSAHSFGLCFTPGMGILAFWNSSLNRGTKRPV